MEYLIIAAIILAVPAGLIWAIVQLSNLRSRIERLEYQIGDLRKVGTAAPPIVETPVREVFIDTPLQPPIVKPAPPPPAPPSPTPSGPPSPKLVQADPKAKTTGRESQEWEALVGGRLLNRVGALAIIIGVGFFLKYAFDKNWISPAVRVVMGFVAGGGLLYFGKIMHTRKYVVFSQGVVGAGIAIWYLSAYAAFNFYQLVSQPIAFLLMSATTVVAVWRGIRHDSPAIATLGWLGGFLTPFLLRTEVVNHIGFLTYIGLLAAGVRLVSIWRPSWNFLGYLSFVGLTVHYWGWYDECYTADKALIASTAVMTFWGIFVATESMVAKRQRPQERDANHILAGVQAGHWAIALYLALHVPHRYGAAMLVAGMAAIYVSIGIVLRRGAKPIGVLIEQYYVQAVALIVAATAIALSEYRQVIAIAGEAAVFSWIAGWRKVSAFRYAIFALIVLLFFRLLWIEHTLIFEPILDYRFMINERALALLSITVAFVLGSRWLHDKSDDNAWILQSLSAGYCVSLFLLFTVETLDYFRWVAATHHQLPLEASSDLVPNLSLALGWSVLAIGLVSVGGRTQSKVVWIAGCITLELALLGGMIVGWSYDPAELFTPFFNVRAIVLICIGAAHIWSLRFISRSHLPDLRTEEMARALKLGLFILGFYFLTVETWDIFDRSYQLTLNETVRVPGRLASIADMQQLALSGVWLVYSIVLMTVGIWKLKRALRIASLALFGITILKIFLWDLTFLTGVYRILSFIGLGVILLSVSFAYQRYKDVILGGNQSGDEVNRG